MAWKLAGTYMETCNCAVACPCAFLSDPTEGVCGLLTAWHIDQGHDGDVALDGLNVAMAVDSPGNMSTTKWRVALYLDSRASKAQHEALLRIFSGKAGGYPGALASLIGEVLGVRSVPIDMDVDERRIRITLGDVGHADVEQLKGHDGETVTISGHPLAIAPGYPATVGKSRELAFNDFGMSWTESGKTAFYSPFTYGA